MLGPPPQRTFEVVVSQWILKIAPTRSTSTHGKVKGWLDKNVSPVIGKKPIANIKPRDVLAAVQKMEARGAAESAHRVKQLCCQIFRFAVALDLVERDITADLRGALAPTVKGNFAAITEPKQVGALMRAVYDYHGFPAASIGPCVQPHVPSACQTRNDAAVGGLSGQAAVWRRGGAAP